MSRHDWILLLCISLAIVLMFGLQTIQENMQTTSDLVIEVTAPEVTEPAGLTLADLEKNNQERIWEIHGQEGLVKLQFLPGHGLAIIESNCPDQICVRTGFISKPGQSTICVPNQVMVALHTQKKLPEKGDLDAILR